MLVEKSDVRRKLLLVTMVMVIALSFAGLVSAKHYEPTWRSLKQYPVPQWLKDGKVVDENGNKVDLGVSKVAAENIPSASNLLDRYTQALDSTLSFIEHYEQSTKFSYRVAGGLQDKGKKFIRGQVRHDDQRIYYQEYNWGDFNIEHKDVPEDKPYYRCRVV